MCHVLGSGGRGCRFAGHASYSTHRASPSSTPCQPNSSHPTPPLHAPSQPSPLEPGSLPFPGLRFTDDRAGDTQPEAVGGRRARSFVVVFWCLDMERAHASVAWVRGWGRAVGQLTKGDILRRANFFTETGTKGEIGFGLRISPDESHCIARFCFTQKGRLRSPCASCGGLRKRPARPRSVPWSRCHQSSVPASRNSTCRP